MAMQDTASTHNSGSTSTIMSRLANNRLLSGNWLTWIIVALAAHAWIATPIILGRIGGFTSAAVQFAIGMIGLVSFAVILFALGKSRLCERSVESLSRLRPPGFVAILIIGVALRALWALAFPAIPTSDGQIYLELAERILREHQYVITNHHAYWPPGYPFYLVPWLLVLPAKLAVPVSQIFLFVVAALGVLRLAQSLNSERTGLWSALFVAIWPTLFTMCSTPEKEALVVALLPWIALGVLSARKSAQFLAGLALGWACLTQPAFLPMILLALLVLVLVCSDQRLSRSIVLLAGVLLVVSPWSLRNQQHFGTFVAVSTNGGDNFYRANNPLADGGYMERGEVLLPREDELAMDRLGKQLGMEWIKSQPLAFLKLAVDKQLRFMGDDSSGVFFSLKRGQGSSSNLLYTVAKLASNFWWLFVWLILASAALRDRKSGNPARFLIWFWLYLFVLHSVFESNGKYHIPMLWVLCILLAQGISRVREPLPGRP